MSIFLWLYNFILASGGNISGSPSLLGAGMSAAAEETSVGGGEYEVEEDGAHDTITSLAGVKVLQRYRKSIRKGSQTSLSGEQLSGQQRLEDLFLIEEDGKDDTLPDESSELMMREGYAIKAIETKGKI